MLRFFKNFSQGRHIISVTRRYSKIQTETFTENDLSVNNKMLYRYLEGIRDEFYRLRSDTDPDDRMMRRIRQLSSVVGTFEERNCVLNNLTSLKDIADEKDEEMKALVKEEREVYQGAVDRLNKELMEQILRLDDSESYSSMMFEVSAGVGGQEAMLFAQELFEMYTNYMDYKGWEHEIIEEDRSDIGGLRHATVIVKGDDSFKLLQHEGGVHRVQRVPATEKTGRMHTSTVSVAVIPRPDNIDASINEKDLKIETKRASGAGGQHVNTTDSAVRIVHLPTGTAVECQTERSQVKNKEIALRKLQMMLYQKELDKQEASTQTARKSQVGQRLRNEKIRTYNYAQDRITDHRMKNGTCHNLKEFLEGNEDLDNLINQIAIEKRKADLVEAIQNLSKDSV